MSEYFQRVANDVLKASEELSAVMEDGISEMFKTKLGGAADTAGSASETADGEFEGDDFEMIEEDLMNNPLQGITEGVLSDLMQNQVGTGVSNWV